MRKLILPVILVTALVLFFVSDARHHLSFSALAQNYSQLAVLVEQNWLACWIGYMVLYAAVVALSLPAASLLTLAGGALLGWPSVLLIITGATAGACLVFLAAQNFMSAFFRKRATGFIARLEAGFKKDAFSYLLALRLIPAAPFWVVNIVPALLGMNLRAFALATFIGIAPGTTIYVWVGRSFEHVLASGDVPDLSVLTQPQIIAPLIALGLLSLIPVLIRRIRDKQGYKSYDN